MRHIAQHSFFNFISNTFGLNIAKLLKTWININKDLIRITTHNKYLLACKRSNVFPKHLNRYIFPDLSFYNDTIKTRAKIHTNRFMLKMINLEINDNFKQRRMLISSIYHISRNIEKRLPAHICYKFFRTQNLRLYKFCKQENCRLSKKLRWIMSSKETSEKHIDNMNLKYCCTVQSDNSQHVTKFSLNSNNLHSRDRTYVIELNSTNYNHHTKNLLEPRDKWFINASNTQIPNEVIGLLQLGEGFCLPPTNIFNTITECIKSVEYNFSRFPLGNNNYMFRNQLFPYIYALKNIDSHRKDIDHNILSAVSTTKRFIKNNPDVLFTRADKGNSVVALDKDDYISKMETILMDSNTYTLLKRNPVNKLLIDLKEILKRWLNHKYISTQTHTFLNSSNAILPRAYGLPKIHKPGYPMRIIVSSTGSPLHNLASFLHKILCTSLPVPPSHIDNSFDLIKKLSDVHIPDDFSLVSLDVISLFTNVPVDLIIDIIKEKWSYISKHTILPENEFIYATNFVLNSTYFLFNNKYYKQTYGAPMGSPLSPMVADLIMQSLESQTINNLSFAPTFYFRYVDDIALAAPSSYLNNLLLIFNSFHPRLKFTLENGGDVLNFLDLTLIKKEGRIIFNWYRKPTFSGRFLNFHSQHPFLHKKGTIISLIDRVILLSHPQFHKDNFDLIINILIDNGYPLDLIFSIIKRRLYCRFQTHDSHKKTVSENSQVINPQPFFTIPYVSCIATKFIQFFKNISFCKLSFSCLNKLNKFIKVHKDHLSTFSRSNVVYKIDCSNCDASYVGQTKRLLKDRIGEHRNHIKRNSNQISVITNHRRTFKHDFDWNNVNVLDEEINYKKRLISEMIHIKNQKCGLNSQNDTELLDPLYHDLVQQFH